MEKHIYFKGIILNREGFEERTIKMYWNYYIFLLQSGGRKAKHREYVYDLTGTFYYHIELSEFPICWN